MTRRTPFLPDEPHLAWLTKDGGPDREMRLLQRLIYTDWDSKEWPVEAQLVVDGATIPAFLWSTVGSPYTGDYRRASIIHDYWCHEGGNAGRLAADRMFRRACLDGGCSAKQAWLLYIGVRIGSFADRRLVEMEARKPTLDYENPGLPSTEDRPYLDVFRRAAITAEQAGFPEDDEGLMDRLDSMIELELLRGNLLPRL